MNGIETYFNAEKTSGVIFTVAGVLAIAVAAWGWRHGAFWRGAAGPLVLIALLQLGVGSSLWWRHPQQLQRVSQIVAHERARIACEEIPRVRAVIQSYSVFLRIEIAVLVAALALWVLSARGGVWQGLGAGLAVQAGLVLMLDGLAERRANTYLAWLQSL